MHKKSQVLVLNTWDFRPLTKAQNTKKKKYYYFKVENSGEIPEFSAFYYSFSFKTNLGSQYKGTVLASVRLVCTLSQHSAKLMTNFVIS